MENNASTNHEAFIAHDIEHVSATMSALQNPINTVRYEERLPEQKAAKKRGEPGVRLFLIEQCREGFAEVLAIRKERLI